MSIQISKLTKEEAKILLDGLKVTTRFNETPETEQLWKKLQEDGWKIEGEYSIEKKYQGYFIVIEFCIGDFCVYPCSKNNHWLLEKKTKCMTFIEALAESLNIQQRIDNGQHWIGEED